MAAHEVYFYVLDTYFNNVETNYSVTVKELLSDANEYIDGFFKDQEINNKPSFDLKELNRVKGFIDIVRRHLITSQKTLTDLKYLNLIYYDRIKDRLQYFEED